MGDITADQFRSLANIQRHFKSDVRLSNRQNVPLLKPSRAGLPALVVLLKLQMACAILMRFHCQTFHLNSSLTMTRLGHSLAKSANRNALSDSVTN
jgi:hypothetical protein